ncbi:Alpha/Beta hydrolase protein [Leptodontidium sp. 2 PMI_412]|nr:Alpha/Beta hydrolase protein [Leptodontidium sp. 2 PMI_412]
MMHRLFLFPFFVASTLAQYPPSALNLTTIKSPVDGNITISYKSPPAGTCETAFPTQQQYTGWVHLPGSYPTNTFFWFIGARDPTDQLTVWLNGGPGSSSMIGLFNENGPCEVVELGLGELGTKVRDWGWDRGSNMLFIDQPNQVGFSYDTPTNGSIDLLTSDLYTPPQVLPNSQPATTFMNGTFSSLNVNNTANTTEIAGMVIWHMLQGFLGAFPEYGPNSSTTMGVHLFAESYGGKYGPAFASIWEEQNLRRSNGTLSRSGTIEIKLASLGIVNGCVDDLIQSPFYPAMAVNNSYGLSAINPTRARLASASFSSEGGCADLIRQCRTAVNSQDPDNEGDVSVVNSICSQAYSTCSTNVIEPYFDSGRSIYDIAHYIPDPFPPSTYLEYLNTGSVLAAIGSPVNFTQTNRQVVAAFTSTGDYERMSLVPEIAKLLNAGIRVGFMYGDRDYICNWLGGEAISLAVAEATSPAYASIFPESGYAPIIVNTSYIGGVVRQYGNLSFSRIYDAGHSVPAYQPETAFQVFARIMSGTSVSTGEIINPSLYNSTGPLNSTHTASLPSSPSATCWQRNIPETCNGDQKQQIINGEGVIINGILYDETSDWSSAASSSLSSTSSPTTGSVTVTTTTQILTGFFTATATPSPTKSFGIMSSQLNAKLLALPALGMIVILLLF